MFVSWQDLKVLLRHWYMFLTQPNANKAIIFQDRNGTRHRQEFIA